MSEHEEYALAGYVFQDIAYTLPDGGSFTIKRPVGLPHEIPYYGRTITLEELLAVWEYHAKPLHS
jgi:hypothetical protein